VVGVLLLVALVVDETRVEQPVMPLRLFRSRERAGALLAACLLVTVAVLPGSTGRSRPAR
jgi:hypothetical protein